MQSEFCGCLSVMMPVHIDYMEGNRFFYLLIRDEYWHGNFCEGLLFVKSCKTNNFTAPNILCHKELWCDLSVHTDCRTITQRDINRFNINRYIYFIQGTWHAFWNGRTGFFLIKRWLKYSLLQSCNNIVLIYSLMLIFPRIWHFLAQKQNKITKH